MLVSVDCDKASATPDTISPPSGTALVCVDVICNAPTSVMVHYELPGATVTFCDGTSQTTPVSRNCANGVTPVCETLCFMVSSAVSNFPVLIVINDPVSSKTFRCAVRIQVQTP